MACVKIPMLPMLSFIVVRRKAHGDLLEKLGFRPAGGDERMLRFLFEKEDYGERSE